MRICILLASLTCAGLLASAQPLPVSVTYPPADGPGRGRHVVLLAGDEEYRSEEALPMLAKILARRHGFRTTVLFSVDAAGVIDPKATGSLSNPEALDTADAVIMSLRFRNWPPETMARFARRLDAGIPIVALRTSTHAFNGLPADGPWAGWNYNRDGGFGKRVLGETWLTHWGRHKVEGTRGVIEPGSGDHPVLKSVDDVHGDTDVYEAYPPDDATILMRGLVLATLDPQAAPAVYLKRRSTDKQEQPVNDPAMPVAWTREYRHANGATSRVLTTTLGSATDLRNEGLRRLVVNGVYWGLRMDVPAKADVRFVDPYDPSFYGFDGFRRGLRASDFEIGRQVPGEPLRPPVK